MKNNSLMIVAGAVAAEGVLWGLAPGLATMMGVVLGLFVIALWREGASMSHPTTCTKFNVEDFQRRMAA
jgi:hypothetical protein